MEGNEIKAKTSVYKFLNNNSLVCQQADPIRESIKPNYKKPAENW